MTPTKQRFQCFDSVVDKPSLTASHNFAVAHRSSLPSTHLEQLENCRFSPSSECQHAKPLSSAVSGNHSASWYQPQSPSHQHTSRRPMRPEGDTVNGITHHHQDTCRRYKRILLVKNSNPSIQKTILLHRKPVHSFGVFLDDVSELMQCLIRKLYTLDGCKVDSIQSLLQGPGVLVCVGREPFHPLLLESFQKNSEDKLPNLIFKSCASTCSEDQGYKKNVNFGQKSKKRMPTGSFPQARENMLNDDIEKRVIVNEDGSLSMEMKVRFRLNDKTLHCSTEIKKSSCTFNVSFPGQDNAYYPHCGHGESCSETESLSASEADDVYVAKVCQDCLEEPQCQYCCTQCQKYDILKIPALSEQETLRHFGSTRLRGSHKIKCKKESVESVHTTSCEENTEHVIEKATYIHQTVGEENKGDNTIQYCTVSRCCSCSEVCTVSANAKKAGYTDEERGQNDQMSVQITQSSIEDERPLSVETNSSDILASLKEDEDKEETDLSLSNSRASQSKKENDKQTRNAIVSPYLLTPCKPLESPKQSLSSRTSSTGLCSSVKSKTFRKVVVKETLGNVDQDENNAPLSTPHRRQHKESTDGARESGISGEESEATNQSEDVLKSRSDLSKTDTFESAIPKNKMEEPANVASAMSPNSNVSASPSRAQSEISVHSTISKLSSDLELLADGGEQTEEVMPDAISTVSRSSQISDLETSELSEMNDQIEDRSPSIISIKSSISEATPVKLVKVQSAKSLKSALSTKTNISVQSRTSKLSEGTPVDMDNRLSMLRVPSAMFIKSDASVRSKTSSILDISPHDSDVAEEEIEGRAPSAKSNKSSTSSRSNTPKITPVANKVAVDPEKERLKRPSSIMSSRSAFSVRSTKCKLRDDNDDTAETTKQLQDRHLTSAVPSETSDSELSKAETSEATLDKSVDFKDKSEERASSTITTKLNIPTKVNKSDMSDMGGKEERSLRATSSKSNVSKKSGKCRLQNTEAAEGDHAEERPASIMSGISVKSKMSVVTEAMCQNEEDEPKQTGRRSQNSLSVRSQRSRKSIVSDAPRQGTGNEDNEERSPSAMSRKSILSDRSNFAPDGVDNTGTTEVLVKEKDDRAASAMSCKSQLFSLSNNSKDQTQERVPTSLSAKSNVSSKSKNSKIDQSKEEGEEKHDRASILVSPSLNTSARSKKSVSPAEEENQIAERSLQSVMSGKSNASKKSKESAVADCFKESQNANNKEFVKRCPSAVSAKSNTSGRSKGSDTQSNRPMEKICLSTISAKSSTSAKDENFSIASNNSPNVGKIQSEETWDIKIKERAPVDVSTNSSISSRSVKSNISALPGGQLVSVNERSDSALAAVNTCMTENSNNADNEERASSSLSKKSNTRSVHHNSERVLTPASASVSIGIVEEYDVDNAEEDNSVSLASVNSAAQLNSKSDVYCKVSSKKIENECQESMQTPDDRTNSSLTAGTVVSDKSKKSECSHQNTTQPITDNEVANNKYAKKNSKKASSQSLSSKSAHSDFGPSKVKCKNSSAVTDRPKGNVSTTLSQLEVNGQKSNAKAKRNCVGAQSKSNLSSNMHFNKEQEISRPCSEGILITAVLTNNGPSRQKSKDSVIPHDVSNHSSPSLNENGNTLITTRDLNGCNKICNGFLAATDCKRNINDNKKSENTSISSCRQSNSSMAQKEDNDPSELVPSILPSSSPYEVVNEWLRKIPLDSAFYDVGDEFLENCEELLEIPGNITQYERGNGSEEDADVALFRAQNEQVGDKEIENVERKLGGMKETAKDFATLESIPPSTFSCSSSSVLMRILLNPKLDRCNSLPEVSHVYGRKLSTSASGFLENLVNLQLLDFDPNDANGKAEKYNHLMNILQSLWLCDPSDRVTITHKSKFSNQKSNDEKINIKSSSGGDINSSPQVSGKHRVNESVVTQKSQTNINAEETEILTKVEDKTDPATPDIASRVRWTPDHHMQDKNTLSTVSDFSQATDTASILNMSCSHKDKANQMLPEHEEDRSSETPPSEQMAELREKVSQNPDPVWVLNLLNNIEKQFMTHYMTSMAEFKVRWNLNDNEQLDAMICELRDEVHKRIQASINNELRKIQGQAGIPRPPKEPLSCESSILTEQRRRRLKVNLSQSITNLAETTDDNNTTVLMADLNGQRNDNDYCLCDTCINKKMSSRHVLAMDVSNSAPMMIDFDLRRILNLKRKGTTESKEKIKENGNEEKHTFGNLAEHFLLKSLKMEETQELCKANLEVQNGRTDIETQIKITGDEICNELGEEKGFLEIEPVREKHALEAGPTRENIAVEADAVGEQEEAEGQSTAGEETEVQKSDTETGNETGTNKTSEKIEFMGERKSEGNEATEGNDSKSDLEELGETPDDGKEMHKNTKTWTNMLAKHDTAAETESNKQEVVKNEIAIPAKKEEPKSKSDGIIYPEDGKEDDTIEAEKTKRTDNEERDDDRSVEKDLAIKIISKESEDDLSDEERTSNPAEDEDVTEPESVEGANPMSQESIKEELTDDELDAERKTTESETATDEEPGDNKTAEYGEKCSDDTSDRIEINQVKTGENREIDNNVTTEDGDTIEGQLADNEERGEVKEDDDCESAEDRDTDDEISKFEKTPCSEPKDEIKSMITENEETCDDETSDDEAVPGAVVSEGKETAESAEENGNEEEDQCDYDDDDDDDDDDDERAEETKRAETETEEEIVHNGIVEVGDESNKENVQKTEGEQSDDGKTADGRANETPEDTEMDASQTEEEGETADNEADDGEIVDEGTAEEAEDGDTPNDSTAEDADEKKTPVWNLEDVEETTETETEDHEAKEDNGIADEQTDGDELTNNKATTGTKNEENEETDEVNTGEDEETVYSRTTEDELGKADVEVLSENEIAQNEETAKETSDVYKQTDDSDTLEKRETAIKMNGETHESYIAKADTQNTQTIIETNNLKKISINQEIEIFVRCNRYNGNTHSLNTEESDEGGDEDEDESESVVRTKDRAQGMTIPAKQAAKWLQYEDGQADKSTTASFISTGKVYTGSEDGGDADGEDSETEVHNNDGSVKNEDE